VQFASDPRKRRQTGKNRIRTLAPTWQNTYYLEHTGLFRVSLSQNLQRILAQEGLTPVLVDTSEFEKSGGSVFCMKAFIE